MGVDRKHMKVKYKPVRERYSDVWNTHASLFIR